MAEHSRHARPVQYQPHRDGYVARFGPDALAGMALVTPAAILMQNMSQGAMGGGISSAIARALGAGHCEEADGYVVHGLFINGLFGIVFTVIGLLAGAFLYRILGGQGASLHAALIYSTIVFAGMVPLWIFNASASIIRGTAVATFQDPQMCLRL